MNGAGGVRRNAKAAEWRRVNLVGARFAVASRVVTATPENFKK
jgi:hypothetical protein